MIRKIGGKLNSSLVIGVLGGILLMGVWMTGQPTPCALGAGECPVGSSSVFSNTIGIQGGTTFTATLTAAPTANRTVTFPDDTGVVVLNDTAQRLTNKTLTLPQIDDTSEDHQYVFAVNELASNRTVTLPLLTGGATFSFVDFAETFSAVKTFSAEPVFNDNIAVALGTSSDARLYYDGSDANLDTTSGDLILNPNADVVVQGALNFGTNQLWGSADAVSTTNRFYFLQPIYTVAASQNGRGMTLAATVTQGSAHAGGSLLGLDLGSTLVSIAGAANNYFATLNVGAPNITLNTSTLTTGATVRIVDAPTEATNNYALLVDDGISRFDGNIEVAADINPEANGTRDLGTQTTAQWANVWSDLVNGADYGFENGWRALESDTYDGYGPGIAFDFGPHFITGKALSIKRVKTGTRQETYFDRDGVERTRNVDVLERQRVLDHPATPTFAVTDDFIEYKGRRITPEILDQLLALVAP